MLANPKIEGWLTITPKLVRGDGLRLTSAKWTGKLSLLIDLVTGRFQVLLSGAMQRYLIPGLGIVDVMTDLKVVPGPGRQGLARRRHRQGLGPPPRQQFLPRPDRRAAVAHDEPRARKRRDRPLHQPPALFARSFGCPARASGSRTAPSTSSRAAGRRNTGRSGWCSTVISSGRGIDLFLASPNEALGIRAMHLLLNPTAAGFDYRASGGSKLGPFTSNGQILLPNNAPTVIAIAALDAGGAHASGQSAVGPRRFHRPADARQRLARRDARFLAGLGRAADRRASRRQQRQFPGRLRGAQRPRRRHHHPRRRAHDDRRRDRRARACRRARLPSRA